MLSGVFFPLDTAPLPIQLVMLVDPLFYGVELLRWCLNGTTAAILGSFGWLISLSILSLFALVMVVLGTLIFNRVQI